MGHKFLSNILSWLLSATKELARLPGRDSKGENLSLSSIILITFLCKSATNSLKIIIFQVLGDCYN